jgi:Fe-S-cluster containining protein
MCCIIRDYPGIRLVRDPKSGETLQIRPESMGKEGIVELEEWELPKMMKLARKLKKRVDETGKPIPYRFLPARGVSLRGAKAPEKVISYWLMGRYDDGDMCPFLSTPAENLRTEDGTLKCLIYEDRPLQCRAYPIHATYTDRITGEKVAELDQGCEWVIEMSMMGEDRVQAQFPLDLIRNLDYGSFARLRAGIRLDSNRTTLWAHPTAFYGRGEKPKDEIQGWVEVGWG